MMFGFYIRNNIGIAFQCFAGGIFAGLGSLFFLAFNGVAAGSPAGYLTARGHGETFYSFVVTHGAFELTAIVLAGAAGLRLGHALLVPGRHTRRAALERAAGTPRCWSTAWSRCCCSRPRSRRSGHRRAGSAGAGSSASAPRAGSLVLAYLAGKAGRARGGEVTYSADGAAPLRVDALALQLRPRSMSEAADLGVRLVQAHARSVWATFAPLYAFVLAAISCRCRSPGGCRRDLAQALAGPHLVVRAVARVFGKPTRLADVWAAQRQVWQWLPTPDDPALAMARLHPARAAARRPARHGLAGAPQAAARQAGRRAGDAPGVRALRACCCWACCCSRWFTPGDDPRRCSRRCSRAVRAEPRRRGRLRRRRAAARAVLRRRRLRDVPEPPRRARGLGHRTGVSPCVRALRAGLRPPVRCRRGRGASAVRAAARRAHAAARDASASASAGASASAASQHRASASAVRADPDRGASGRHAPGIAAIDANQTHRRRRSTPAGCWSSRAGSPRAGAA